jgi:hypothetical protein
MSKREEDIRKAVMDALKPKHMPVKEELTLLPGRGSLYFCHKCYNVHYPHFCGESVMSPNEFAEMMKKKHGLK